MNDPKVVEESSLKRLRSIFAAGGLGLGNGEALGMRGVEADAGRVVLEACPKVEHQNPLGTVHGGYLATLLDAAMGLAVHTKLNIGARYATTNLNISYLLPIPGGGARITAEAKVLRGGRNIFFVEARIVDESGAICTHGTASFMVAR